MAQQTTTQPTASQLSQMNMTARQAVLHQAVDMMQQVYTTTISSNVAGTVLNIQPRPVGLIKRFIVEVAATLAGTAGVTHTLTAFGVANLLSSVILTDLSNNQRINTAGWHLMAISSAKARQAFGSALYSDTPLGYGDNFQATMQAPLSITGAGSVTVNAMFEIPVTYSDFDLRGAIFASTTNATMNLQLTVNPNIFVSSTADATLAVYQSNGATLGTVSSMTITVYQNYLDQLPVSKSGYVLPLLDLSTNYLLTNTALTGLVVSQDFPVPYPNFRDIMSTTAVYDNNGVLNTGSDINYFSLTTANFTNVFKYDPNIPSLLARQRLQDDFPKGMYYFDHRRKPINTNQYGNMQLNLNPSAVTAGASLLIGWEMLAFTNNVTQAGSLAAS